jgi:hypothetical protein
MRRITCKLGWSESTSMDKPDRGDCTVANIRTEDLPAFAAGETKALS